MKTFLIAMAIFPIFIACTSNNAFTQFNMTPEQEKNEDMIQSSKIFSGKRVNGIISTTYLNKIYPKKYANNEYFYVYLYTEGDEESLKFYLNGIESVNVTKLESENIFSNLTLFKADWQEYYLVEFDRQEANLGFIAKSTNFASHKMIFKKEE